VAQREHPVGPGPFHPLRHPVAGDLRLHGAHRPLKNPHAEHQPGDGQYCPPPAEPARGRDKRQQQRGAGQLDGGDELRAALGNHHPTGDLRADVAGVKGGEQCRGDGGVKAEVGDHEGHDGVDHEAAACVASTSGPRQRIECRTSIVTGGGSWMTGVADPCSPPPLSCTCATPARARTAGS
jgi:hypothetical protein